MIRYVTSNIPSENSPVAYLWKFNGLSPMLHQISPIFSGFFRTAFILPTVSTKKICSRFRRGWTQPDSAQELPRGVEPLHCHGGAAVIFLRMRPRFWVMHGLWVYNICVCMYIILYCIILYYIVLYYFILYYIILNYFILYYFILYYFKLYYIIVF